jgi:hypothetical protein
VRPDPLSAPVPGSAFTGGKTMSGQRVTGSAGTLLLEPMPGSPLAADALLIELPDRRRGLLDLIVLLLAELGLELPVSRQHRHPELLGTAAPDVDVFGVRYVTSDQLKLAGSPDRLAAAGGR